MRLIDADRLIAKITAMVSRSHQFMYEIERAPTVEAIPIERINKWLRKYGEPILDDGICKMIEDWEKENERP